MSFQKFGVFASIDALIHDLVLPFLRRARPYLQPTQWLSAHGSSASQKQNISSKTTITSQQSRIAQVMPPNAWDSHMHVTSPAYPLAPTAAYRPTLHSLQHALNFESTINLSNIVLVQPSIYGTDNSCLLDALRSLGPRRGRGVVGIDPETIDLATLQQWHELGVRGVRLNLKSNDTAVTEEGLRDELKRYADVIRPLNWVLELFIGMSDIPILERVVSTCNLDVHMCIAHFGAPKLPPMSKRTCPVDPYQLAGFQSLVNMLRRGDTWIKFSAAYRFDEDPEMRGIEALAIELLRIAGDRLVFASDWPHTRFDGLDVRPFVERCLEWTEGVGRTEDVFVGNARRLWDVEG